MIIWTPFDRNCGLDGRDLPSAPIRKRIAGGRTQLFENGSVACPGEIEAGCDNIPVGLRWSLANARKANLKILDQVGLLSTDLCRAENQERSDCRDFDVMIHVVYFVFELVLLLSSPTPHSWTTGAACVPTS